MSWKVVISIPARTNGLNCLYPVLQQAPSRLKWAIDMFKLLWYQSKMTKCPIWWQFGENRAAVSPSGSPSVSRSVPQGGAKESPKGRFLYGAARQGMSWIDVTTMHDSRHTLHVARCRYHLQLYSNIRIHKLYTTFTTTEATAYMAGRKTKDTEVGGRDLQEAMASWRRGHLELAPSRTT